MSEATAAQVIPNIYVDEVEILRSFYVDELGFQHMMGMVGKDGKLDFCIVRRDPAMIMLARPQGRIEGTARTYPTARPVEIYVPVKDVDAYHGEVAKRSVAVTCPLTTQWWGDRNFAVDDPYGYRVWFYETVETWEKLVASGKVPPPGVTLV